MNYDIILADPPWQFKVWTAKGSGRSAEQHYPVMSIDDICNLDVGRFTAENAALFLWVVWPCLFDAQRVIESWGFTYRTIAWTWVKSNKSGLGFFTGMGYYSRSNTEPCLLAVKGRMPVDRHDVLALIHSPVRQHSQKPYEQYTKIEALYPDKKYLELFARKNKDGWDAWGNEVKSDISLPAVKALP